MWRIKVELEFPVEAQDVKDRHPGDTEVDFGYRALDRVQKHLELLLVDSPFEHYHILQMPDRGWTGGR